MAHSTSWGEPKSSSARPARSPTIEAWSALIACSTERGHLAPSRVTTHSSPAASPETTRSPRPRAAAITTSARSPVSGFGEGNAGCFGREHPLHENRHPALGPARPRRPVLLDPAPLRGLPAAAHGRDQRLRSADVEDRLVLAGERGTGQVLGHARGADRQRHVAQVGGGTQDLLVRLSGDDEAVRNRQAGARQLTQVGRLGARDPGIGARQLAERDDVPALVLGTHCAAPFASGSGSRASPRNEGSRRSSSPRSFMSDRYVRIALIIRGMPA